MKLSLLDDTNRTLCGCTRVYFNGQYLAHCQEADDELGYVLVHLPLSVQPKQEKPQLLKDSNDKPIMIRLEGKVEFKEHNRMALEELGITKK